MRVRDLRFGVEGLGRRDWRTPNMPNGTLKARGFPTALAHIHSGSMPQDNVHLGLIRLSQIMPSIPMTSTIRKKNRVLTAH